MKFSHKNDDQHEFQIAPMIDIVFLLLVFFIVSYSMTQIERELSINLPEADESASPTSRINEVVVNVAATGQVIVNQRPMSSEQLLERLKRIAAFGDPPAVILRADANCPHKYVVAVMDTCAKADIHQILFSTLGEEARRGASQ